MNSYDLIVIGGCSAGLAAAISAKRINPALSVAVFEKLPRVGKKLLATGNGKCNLTNMTALEHDYRNREFASAALECYSPERIVDFFATLGLLCYEDSCGRVYPRSNTAASVVDALRFELERLGVQVFCDTSVISVKKEKNIFIINNQVSCHRLIIAAGGKASPAQGSDGGGYALAKMLGHSVEEPIPALVPLCTSSGITKALKGIRAHDVVLTLKGNVASAKSRGEILFTDYGLSGIAAMELGAAAQRCLNSDKQNPFTLIDFMPDSSCDELAAYLDNLRDIKGFCDIDNLLTGLLPKALGIAICKAAKLYKSGEPISALNSEAMRKIAEKIKQFPLEIAGTRGFANAQVASGGVKVDEIDKKTMQSKLCKGLYFAGEIIDVDGGCGGFNLQWAWASGMLAGEQDN